MRQAEVVIGAGFGDEGKGLVTDTLAAKYGKDAVVVRFNGGAQAGHTVTIDDSRRHVFHHVGSGALAGAETYLSRFFVCNPLTFGTELPLLARIGCNPVIAADPDCMVTTPYDMMINQLVEEQRGATRHGSCGQGFGETIARNAHPGYGLRCRDLRNEAVFLERLGIIARDWVSFRLAQLGVTQISEVWRIRLQDSGILDYYLRSVANFLDRVTLRDSTFLQEDRAIIFEGAQGLMLDQDKGWFPHVTRSHTGLRNVMTLAGEAGINALTVHYLTRAYATRHGAGPLAHEVAGKPYAHINDATNIPNEFQGSLRFGWLDLDLLARFISADLADHQENCQIKPVLGLTCLDQVDDRVTFVERGALKSARKAEFIQILLKRLRMQQAFVSTSPVRGGNEWVQHEARALCNA